MFRIPTSRIAVVTLVAGLSLCATASAAPPETKKDVPPDVVFVNVRVFDGKSGKLTDVMNVAVTGNVISRVTKDGIQSSPTTRVIKGEGRVLMPGMIDAHVHATIGLSLMELLRADVSYITLRGAAELEKMLNRGFTTVRDMGGNTFALKQAIDEGLTRGPRVYPSGAMISQTSGHGDYRLPSDRHRRWGGRIGIAEQLGIAIVADGKDEVLAAVREQMRLGASQIKLAAGGGVISFTDPLYVKEFTKEELHTAVQAADDWDTYVSVHLYTAEGCRRAIEAGVRCLEHAHLIDDSTMKLAGAKGVFLSTQALSFLLPLEGVDEATKKRNQMVADFIPRMFDLAKKHKVKVCFGTDLLLAPQLMAAQSQELTARLRWFTSAEILVQATGNNSELLALSKKRNPYGKVGVIEEGALADLLLVDGDPLQNLKLLTEPEKNLLVIMKDGKFHKDLTK